MNDDPLPTQNRWRRIVIPFTIVLIVCVVAWIINRVIDAESQAVLTAIEAERQAALTKLKLEYSHLVYTTWTLNDVQVFLESLTPSELEEFGKLTGESGATAEQLTDHLMRLSYWTPTYYLNNKDDVNYHMDILFWAAKENKVKTSIVYSSFYVERHLSEKIYTEQFNQDWANLNTQQRIELLDKLTDGGLSDSQKAALAAGTGAAALSALSATVAFSGFAFYTTMSTAIATSAGLLGATLPFSVYAGASSTVALLSGPVGWSIALVAGTGAAIWATAPNVEKTTKFILTLHNYKAKMAQRIKKQIEDLGGFVPPI